MRWTTHVEWDANITPAAKTVLSGFLDVVLAHVGTLAARCDGATSEEVVAGLCGYFEQLDPNDRVNELLEAVREQALVAANEGRVREWTAIIAGVLEGAPLPVCWVAPGLLLERSARAALAEHSEVFDADVLLAAANELQEAVRGVLRAVLAHTM
jgi:hypothetical protein